MKSKNKVLPYLYKLFLLGLLIFYMFTVISSYMLRIEMEHKLNEAQKTIEYLEKELDRKETNWAACARQYTLCKETEQFLRSNLDIIRNKP